MENGSMENYFNINYWIFGIVDLDAYLPERDIKENASAAIYYQGWEPNLILNNEYGVVRRQD